MWALKINNHLKVLSECSAEDEPGEMQAIMITLLELILVMKESLKTNVNLDALKGTWIAFWSIPLIHSFSASKLLVF